MADGPEEPKEQIVEEATPEVSEDNSESIDALTTERDKLNQEAGSSEGVPVNEDGDKDKKAQEKDSRAIIKERAKLLREQKNAAKEQKKAAGMQQGTAEQNRQVKVTEGAFGEVKTFKPKYKADADGDTYEEITPASRFSKWMKRN